MCLGPNLDCNYAAEKIQACVVVTLSCGLGELLKTFELDILGREIQY